jgi:hypothetical protein
MVNQVDPYAVYWEEGEQPMTSVNCAWPDCENTVVHGDKESMTEFGGMCPYHKAMITMYNRNPPKSDSKKSA